jgi:surface antigen
VLGRIPLLATTLACGALAWLPSAARSQPPARAGSVHAGDSASMTIAFAGAAGECRLVAYAPGRAPHLISQVRPTGRKVTWIWQVPGGARSATWRLVATCGSSQIGAVLTVHGHRQAGSLSLARGVRVLQYANATSRPEASSVRRAAQIWWASNSGSILSGFHTGSSAGECTSYVAARRPDIIKRVDISAYTRYLVAGSGALNVNWDAMDWPRNARRAGLTVGKTPRAGAVLVFQARAYGATSLGHVAYVSAVARDGSFTITEMHAPVLGRITSRHFDARTARAMVTNPGISFIYR